MRLALLMWWFMAVSSSGAIVHATHGPFMSNVDCEDMRGWLTKHTPTHSTRLSACWWDGTGGNR